MSFEDLPAPARNMMWAGYIFMNTTWIQNQMVYLLILNKNRNLIADFVRTPETLPARFVQSRNHYWAKMFSEMKQEFVRSFREHLSEEEIKDIDRIHMLRNMLAHAQVSMGKNHMFYRPASDAAEKKFIEIMDITPGEDSARPYLVVIDFSNQGILERTSLYIEKVGIGIMERLAGILEVPHYQVR
ncbi:hypothetical protein ACOMQZ_002066 [Enterobacter quasiroggenkampii]